MNRCLNALREAANEMIHQEFHGEQQNVLDIDYYKDEEEKLDNQNEEDAIVISKGKKRNQMQVLDL